MTLLGCKIFIGDTAESTYPNNTIWKPPQLPYSKVNVVLKKCEDGFCYGICALIRDFNGNSVAAKVEVIVSQCWLEAHFTGFWHVLQLCNQQGLEEVQLEGHFWCCHCCF